MWTLIALLPVACLATAAVIVGTVVLVLYLVRRFARNRDAGTPG